MKATQRVIAVLAVIVGATTLASASTITDTVLVDPQGFGLGSGSPSAGGTYDSPTSQSLTSLAAYLLPGYSISFKAVGEICFNPSGSPTCSSGTNTGEVGVGSITNPIIGLFIGSGTTQPTGSTHVNTGPSGTDDWTADVLGSFVVTSTGTGTITIPTGATAVEFVFRDDLYDDNSDHSGTFGVQVSFNTPTPEPATYGMMLAGLGALAAFKRLRRS